MKGYMTGFISAVLLGSTMSMVHAQDIGNIVKAQLVLNQITQMVDQYQDIQALLDSGSIELDVAEPIPNSSGEFVFPFTRDGELTAWAEKAISAQVGSQVAGVAADRATNAIASRVPLGGLAARAARGRVQEAGAVVTLGGWVFIRESSDISFSNLDDYSVYMHVLHNGTAGYEQALAAAMALYPALEQGHQRAVDNAYREARRKTQ